MMFGGFFRLTAKLPISPPISSLSRPPLALMASASGGRDGDETGGLIGSLAVRRKNPPNITQYVPPNERGDVRRRKE